jgi:Txe/YoeB family toxin of Txe-Axe toxin-antitoxin module
MLPSTAEIAKSRLINVLKLDHLEIELMNQKRKEMTPNEFREQLNKTRMLILEDIYEYVFTCLPNKASKERLVNELVDEYTRRLNHQH